MCLYLRAEGFVLYCSRFSSKFERILFAKTRAAVEERVREALLCNEYSDGEEWFQQLRELTNTMQVDQACAFVSSEVPAKTCAHMLHAYHQAPKHPSTCCPRCMQPPYSGLVDSSASHATHSTALTMPATVLWRATADHVSSRPKVRTIQGPPPRVRAGHDAARAVRSPQHKLC